MNCIIIDDETTARVIINQLCSQIDDLTILEEFPNAIQAIKYLNQHEVDLIFLDIHMPGRTGFELLDELDYTPQVIFTTAYSEYAYRSFYYNPVDYLLKPISPERLDHAKQQI